MFSAFSKESTTLDLFALAGKSYVNLSKKKKNKRGVSAFKSGDYYCAALVCLINMKNSKAHFQPGGAERMKMDDPEFPEQLGREKYFLSLNFGVSH